MRLVIDKHFAGARCVIDSNVWVSALVFGGNPRKIFTNVVQNGWRVVVSEEILTEVRRILNQKFPDFVQDFEDLVTVLQPYVSIVKLGSESVTVSRDKDDDMVIETALLGKADFIITGDKDLLVIARFKSIVIVTPQYFLSVHSEHSS